VHFCMLFCCCCLYMADGWRFAIAFDPSHLEGQKLKNVYENSFSHDIEAVS
jgi:hypothetical protein